MKPIRTPKNHYIVNAARNASESLAMAMHLWNSDMAASSRNIPVLVKLINTASIALREECNSLAHEAHRDDK